jgi:aldose 1-epimerase
MLIRPFGNSRDAPQILAVTLTNALGYEATVLTLGATLQALWVPDERGNRSDVVLGHDHPAAYLADRHYFGASVGRHANRIAHGRFKLEGREHQLECNDGENHLHGGGKAAFHRRVWKIEDASMGAVILSLRGEAGEGGYPGQVDVTARYALSDGGELTIEYGAVTDAPTIVNVTNHSYFNLSGSGDVMEHQLTLHASCYAPVDAHLIPTGELPQVTGTPFDFLSPTAVGARIHDPHPQLLHGRGYDHHFVVDGQPGALRRAARLEDPRSGRVLELDITAPGVQFYSGNFLDGSMPGKGGRAYHRGAGLCLEPQGFPDAPNQQNFPSTRLLPGESYSNRMKLRFLGFSRSK